jgi:outer membrane protein OmpA-like peptidoglycan-associated protein
MRYFLFLVLLPFGSAAQTQQVELFFKLNVSTLEKKSIEKLEKLKSQADRISVLSVTAYTDPTGTDAINLPLAESRKNEVLTFLQNAGISVEKSSAPASHYPENAIKLSNHAYWRRVDISYTLKPPAEELEFNGIKLSNEKKELQPIPLTIEF